MDFQKDELWNQKQLSKVLGISEKTAEAWRFYGKGPAYIKVSNRCIRYRAKDVMGYIEDQRVSTTNQV